MSHLLWEEFDGVTYTSDSALLGILHYMRQDPEFTPQYDNLQELECKRTALLANVDVTFNGAEVAFILPTLRGVARLREQCIDILVAALPREANSDYELWSERVMSERLRVMISVATAFDH